MPPHVLDDSLLPGYGSERVVIVYYFEVADFVVLVLPVV
jgi:hypothetical protein